MNLLSLGALDISSICTEMTDVMQILGYALLIIKIAIPLLIIFYGILDFAKAVIAEKEDEIKKAQTLLVKKAIAAALVFLMFSIVSLVFGIVAPDGTEGDNMWSCVDALINNCK